MKNQHSSPDWICKTKTNILRKRRRANVQPTKRSANKYVLRLYYRHDCARAGACIDCQSSGDKYCSLGSARLATDNDYGSRFSSYGIAMDDGMLLDCCLNIASHRPTQTVTVNDWRRWVAQTMSLLYCRQAYVVNGNDNKCILLLLRYKICNFSHCLLYTSRCV